MPIWMMRSLLSFGGKFSSLNGWNLPVKISVFAAYSCLFQGANEWLKESRTWQSLGLEIIKQNRMDTSFNAMSSGTLKPDLIIFWDTFLLVFGFFSLSNHSNSFPISIWPVRRFTAWYEWSSSGKIQERILCCSLLCLTVAVISC